MRSASHLVQLMICYDLGASFIFQLLEIIVKNCGDIIHMLVAERGLPHEMVKIVKKKVVQFTIVATISCPFPTRVYYEQNFICAARLSCKREDFDIDIYLARCLWRTKGEISPILCSLPGAVGMLKNYSFLASLHFACPISH